MGEVQLHLGRTHGSGMAQGMKADEAPHPEEIGLLGAQAVVLVADAFAHLIEQPGRGAGAWKSC